MSVLQRFLRGGMILAVSAAAIGCGSNAGTGALIGGATGAGLGAIIGHQSHGHTAGGAVVGGALGAIGGAIVGNEMDREEHARRDDDGRYRYYDDEPRYRTRHYYYEDPPPRVYEYRVWRDYGPYGPGWYTIREYRY